MIVLWGVPGDGPLDAVREELASLGADGRFVDQRNAARSSATVRVVRGRVVCELEGPTPEDRLSLEHAGALYLRPVETERALPASAASDVDARLRADRVDRALITWADLADTLVVNRPAAMAVNNSKPYQVRAVAGYGFRVPDTLITTDPRAVEAFARRHARVIYKSISGVRSIVSTLRDTSRERLEDVANAPTQFQEWIAGVDVRVHVVGDEVFATEIRSGADDYRYASATGDDLELAPVHVPPEIATRCRTMTAGMGLAVAGIDLRRAADGGWACFEVNPSPAFSFYEEATGQPIGRAIAHLLQSADERTFRERRSRRSLQAARVVGTTV